MSDRKAELERKKAKLEAMRQEKKRKEEERKRREATESANGAPNSKSEITSEADQLLKDLGIPPAGESAPAAAAPVVSQQKSQDESAVSATIPSSQVTPSPQTQRKLMMSKVSQTDIPPKELVSYSKTTQTVQEQVDREEQSFDRWYGPSNSAGGQISPRFGSPRHSVGSPRIGSPHSFGSPKFYGNLEWDDEFAEVLTYDHGTYLDEDNDSMEAALDSPRHGHKMPHVEHIAPAVSQEDKDKKEEVRELSEEERKQILMSEDFNKFFERASSIMERVLSEGDDSSMFINYSGALDMESDIQAGEKLKVNREFFDDRWSKHRTVTCMDWSTQHPELLVASYNSNEDAPHEPDGVALIWNLRFKKTTPEYIFHCQSAVMSTCFAKFHPNLVVGGTYSGQIVLWDNRSNKRTPVQRTPLSAAAHTHPVYCVNVVGTQNAHNLISVSTDGKMCSWSLDMLSQPQDSMELHTKSQSKSVACTSFSFLRDDVNNFVVGSEEGAVYTACRHGSKAGISDVYEGHQGPVTGIDSHCVPGPVDFSQLYLSSSFDWTVKLWSARENKMLYSFEDNSDYVYDVQWSPIHPAVFACVDGAGRLDIWNLNNDTEVPTTSTTVGSNIALNRCRWHQSGHQIAVGDDMGKIHIYDLGEQIASPRNDDWSKFVHTLQELKINAADADHENPSSLTSLSASPLR